MVDTVRLSAPGHILGRVWYPSVFSGQSLLGAETTLRCASYFNLTPLQMSENSSNLQSHLPLPQEGKAVQDMETSSVIPPDADDGGAREADSSHLNKMSLTEPPDEDQNIAGNMQQRPRDAFVDKIDELQQRLVALTTDNSPSKSSNASFTTAQEQPSPTRPSQKALGKQPDPVVSPPTEQQRQIIPVTQTSTRPTTSHRASTRPSTRRGSTAPTSQVPSASSSRREDRVPASTRPSARRVPTGPGSQGTYFSE